MKLTLKLYDDTIVELEEAAVDPMGVTYQENKVILPGQEDVMHMVLIPWASISELNYMVTPDMLEERAAAENQGNTLPVAPNANRKQRRAHLQ